MTYWLLALAALMFGLYNIFIKLSADHINAVLGAVILQFVAAFLGLAVLIYMRYFTQTPFNVTNRGITLAILAGVSIGLVEMVTFYVYSRGIPVALGNPLIIGGSLIVTTGIGIVLLREHVSAIQLSAIALIIIGVAIMAWDGTR